MAYRDFADSEKTPIRDQLRLYLEQSSRIRTQEQIISQAQSEIKKFEENQAIILNALGELLFDKKGGQCNFTVGEVVYTVTATEEKSEEVSPVFQKPQTFDIAAKRSVKL